MLQIKKFVIILFFAYLALAIYGLFFNYTFVDEVKYISKGYYILSGEVSFYNTAGFLYQHTPFSNLWFGLGQIIFGPSLLIARIQSLLLGLATLYISYFLAFFLKNKIAACLTLFFRVISKN